MPDFIAILAGISAAVGAIAGIVVGVKKTTPVVRLIVGVFGDFAGEPARPGVAARPGVMERLASIDEKIDAQGTRIDEQGEQLASIQHELHPNSGKSLRDSINRIETATQAPAVTSNVTVINQPDAA